VKFDLNFPGFAPILVIGQLLFSAVGYSDKLVTILQA
jgi:hypothetical protein